MPNTTIRIYTQNGIQYVFHEDRGKILSIPKAYLRCGIKHRNVSNQYMRLEDAQPSMSVGDKMVRNGTIISVTLNCEPSSTWNLKIFKLGSASPLVTLPTSSPTGAADSTLNVDFNAGDVLSFYMAGVAVKFPRALIELAWRL